jgi:hypothetical protein
MDAGLVKLRLGEKELGKKYLETAIDKRKTFLGFDDAWHYFDIARCYAALKDSRYIENLNKAIQRGWFIYTWLERDPFFDDVRDTPEFNQIWQKFRQQNEKYKAELYAAIKNYQSKKL